MKNRKNWKAMYMGMFTQITENIKQTKFRPMNWKEGEKKKQDVKWFKGVVERNEAWKTEIHST